MDPKDRPADLLPLTVPEVRHLIAGIIARPCLDREQLVRLASATSDGPDALTGHAGMEAA